MITSYTIPYHLRHHKAIERNLFLYFLKNINGRGGYEIKKYRYVGFGAPFLEDFKVMHWEFGIKDMHCIEINEFAHSRQKFNNPLNFIKLFHTSSTDYVTGPSFKDDKNQVIWLDYASPGEIRQQLQDVELLSQKLKNQDIIKLTFNASPQSFQISHEFDNPTVVNQKQILSFLKDDATYKKYYPDYVKVEDILNDFSVILRAMAIRAIHRGLSAAGSDLQFNHITSFNYKDGQAMTTISGIVSKKEEVDSLLELTGLSDWEFYLPNNNKDIIKSIEIQVPDMTFLERVAIDKLIPNNVDALIKNLQFTYGAGSSDHKKLLEGYCKYYRFLPYYAKVTY